MILLQTKIKSLPFRPGHLRKCLRFRQKKVAKEAKSGEDPFTDQAKTERELPKILFNNKPSGSEKPITDPDYDPFQDLAEGRVSRVTSIGTSFAASGVGPDSPGSEKKVTSSGGDGSRKNLTALPPLPPIPSKQRVGRDF